MRFDVAEADTAAVLGTGDVPVLATSRMVTWMEAATIQCAAAFIEAGQTKVGTAVRVEHRRATPVGGRVEVVVEPPATAVDHRLTFTVRAIDSSGEVLAAGEIDRAVVDRGRFLEATPPAETKH